MTERPEDWAYQEFPEDPDAFRKEFLAHQRQQTAYLKQLIEGGAWFAAIGMLFVCAVLASLWGVF